MSNFDDFMIEEAVENNQEIQRLLTINAELLRALEAITNWCDHPGHGGQYDIPKPLLPYLLQGQIAIKKARGTE